MAEVSRWVRIAREIEALLTADGMPEGLSVHRHAHRKTSQLLLPATVIDANLDEDIEVDDHDGLEIRTRSLRIIHRVVIASDRPDEDAVPAEEALDPLLVWTAKQLKAPGAFTEGLVLDVRETSGVGQAVEAEETYAGRIQDFEIDYATLEHDPTETP
jgi:hypothetical protein